MYLFSKEKLEESPTDISWSNSFILSLQLILLELSILEQKIFLNKHLIHSNLHIFAYPIFSFQDNHPKSISHESAGAFPNQQPSSSAHTLPSLGPLDASPRDPRRTALTTVRDLEKFGKPENLIALIYKVRLIITSKFGDNLDKIEERGNLDKILRRKSNKIYMGCLSFL